MFGRETEDPVRAKVSGNSLSVFGGSGRLLWNHTFSERLVDPDTLETPPRGRWLVLSDVMGTGRNQVLFLGSFLPQNADHEAWDRQEIFCFSHKGEILWRYSPQLELSFGGTRFAGPWKIHEILAPVRPGGRLLAALSHRNWRPGAVVAIDGSGRGSVAFANCGNLYNVTRLSTGGKTYILAGGVNNEYSAACAALFAEDAAPSRSPQTVGTRFECTSGPTGAPARYFVLPPTEINSAIGQPYNHLVAATPTGSEALLTTQESGGAGAHPDVRAIYTLTSAMEISTVAFSDDFAVAHRRCEDAGMIRHPLAKCPAVLNGVQARLWSPERGWETASVPARSGVKPDAG